MLFYLYLFLLLKSSVFLIIDVEILFGLMLIIIKCAMNICIYIVWGRILIPLWKDPWVVSWVSLQIIIPVEMPGFI